MSHIWSSKGDKRTIVIEYQPSEIILRYLQDMREALKMAMAYAYVLAKENEGRVSNPIVLRRKIKPWFYSRYDYARHHINPVCRSAIAMLRSYRKRHKHLAIPEVNKLAMRIDSELFKLEVNENEANVRITLQPFKYEWIKFTPKHKKWSAYSDSRASELLITDKKLCITFVVNRSEEKPIGSRLIASDLNFNTVDSTTVAKKKDGAELKLENVTTESIKRIAQVQNDFSRRRRRLQLHVENPQKKARKLRETRWRQRNRTIDALHKLSTKQVKKNPQASFIFERLKGIKEKSKNAERSKKLTTYLNRWPYQMYQSMVEYKSPNKTLYVSPRWTSSECPVCGGILEHPTWAISRCIKCGVDYDRNRLASLAILLRSMRLCGQPFAVSTEASWQRMKNEYLYTGSMPDATRAC